jgi:hypothetical protein
MTRLIGNEAFTRIRFLFDLMYYLSPPTIVVGMLFSFPLSRAVPCAYEGHIGRVESRTPLPSLINPHLPPFPSRKTKAAPISIKLTEAAFFQSQQLQRRISLLPSASPFH